MVSSYNTWKKWLLGREALFQTWNNTEVQPEHVNTLYLLVF